MESFWDFADQMAELVSVMYRCGVSGGVRTSRSQRNSVAISGKGREPQWFSWVLTERLLPANDA